MKRTEQYPNTSADSKYHLFGQGLWLKFSANQLEGPRSFPTPINTAV